MKEIAEKVLQTFFSKATPPRWGREVPLKNSVFQRSLIDWDTEQIAMLPEISLKRWLDEFEAGDYKPEVIERKSFMPKEFWGLRFIGTG